LPGPSEIVPVHVARYASRYATETAAVVGSSVMVSVGSNVGYPVVGENVEITLLGIPV
jgi:hypothetical protein